MTKPQDAPESQPDTPSLLEAPSGPRLAEAAAALEAIRDPQPHEVEDKPEETPDDTPDEPEPAEAPDEDAGAQKPEPEDKPTKEPEKAAPEKTTAAQLEDLRRKAQEAAEKRREKEAEAEPEKPAIDTRARELDDRERKLNETIEAFVRDPLKVLESRGNLKETYDRLTAQLLGEQGKPHETDAIARLEKRITDLQTELQERDEKKTQAAQHREQIQAWQKARADFADFTGSEEIVKKYPLLASLDPQARADYGDSMAALMRQAGEPIAYPRVAEYIEADLRAQYDRWDRAVRGEPEDPEPEPEPPKPKGRKKGQTLTNADAAERSAPPMDPTMDDRMKEAARLLAAGLDDTDE